MKRILMFALTLPLAGLVACWQKPTPRSFTRPVKLTTVTSLASFDKDFVGVVSAEQYTDLAFQVPGLVEKTYVNAGSFVKKGQVLAQVNAQDLSLQSDADKAQYQTTKSILERTERLLAKQAISLQEVEIARSNYSKAKSQYEYSLNQLSYTKLKAPFSGNIEQKYVENFQKVNAGQAIYKLINPDVLEVNFTLPESDVDMTQLKNSYYVEFDNFRGELFEATIKEVVDASVDGAGIPVILAITDKRFNPEKYNIKAGFSCRVRVIIDNSKVLKPYLSVPLASVFQKVGSSDSYVWLYDSKTGTVSERRVSIDALHGSSSVVITEGLVAGDKVVSAGVYQIADNQKVVVL